MIIVSLLCTTFCFGQGLPDRDELVKQFLNESTSEQATRDLCKHFGMGGLRTIIRNVNELPLERRLQYADVFIFMDASRFTNDINANVAESTDAETRAMWLRLLAKLGRGLDPSVFEKYADDASQDMRVRLAAMSGLVQKQDPARFARLYELADEAEVDPTTGRNDLEYAYLTKENQALYYYTKSQLAKDKVSPGRILVALAMADAGDVEIFEKILELRQKKLFPLLIDRATQVGGVAILDKLADEKQMKKFRDEIKAGKAAASALAAHVSKLYSAQTFNDDDIPLGPVLPRKAGGSGREGYHGGFAVVKVAADGTVSVVESQRPFGGAENFAGLPKKTIPAFSKWESVDAYYLLSAP